MYRIVCIFYPLSVVYKNQVVSIIVSLDSHVDTEDQETLFTLEAKGLVVSNTHVYGDCCLLKLGPETKNK